MNILVSELLKFSRIIAMPTAILVLSLYSCEQKKEIERMGSNTSALIQENGKLMKDKKVLQLDSDELKQVISSDSVLKSHLKDSLNIKERRIKMLTTMVSKTETSFQAPLRDTSFVKMPGDTVIIYAKSFKHKSEYLESSGIIYENYVDITYKHEDRISLVIHQTKQGKWFLTRLFEKAKLTASVINSDPSSDILIDKVIIKKD